MFWQCKTVVAALAGASAALLLPGQVRAATVLWSAPGTTVYINPGETLEFENPLTGTETIQGYNIVEWLDADYSAGPPRWYDDWTVNSSTIDGDVNEIWMRSAGHQIWSTSSVPSSVVSIHLIGDGNDGLADVLVDDILVAQLDMGTSFSVDRACVLVTGLAFTTHTMKVSAVGPGQTGMQDVATNGAAVLNAGGPVVKWSQRPDLLITGMDVMASSVFPGLAYVLADDFECTSPGAITDIRFWGSWADDRLPFGDPMAVEFSLSLHDDIPAPPYSMPGNLLWQRTYFPGECQVELFADGLLEGWFEPPDFYIPFGDTMCWLYTCPGPDPANFIQEGTPGNPIIYWLDVQATPLDQGASFGWKTSLDHWNDDAVWAMGLDDGLPLPWEELRYPPDHPLFPESIDLAFEIWGEETPLEDKVVCEPQPPDHPTEYWYEVTRAADWYCDFHVRVEDPDPCNYSNWNVPAGWVFAVHQTGDEWWASWWDPTDGCTNAITGVYTFRFSNPNPSVWNDWTITQGNSPDPHFMVLDESGFHATQPDGLGYRVHVPSVVEAHEYKWIQTPDLNRTGMDVYASQMTTPLPDFVVLADDFECKETGDITEIVVWGSWLGDQLPFGDPGGAVFRLSLHSDNPAGPAGWSMPADWLWGRDFFPGEYLAEPCATDLDEGFFFPQAQQYMPSADSVCWKYTFSLAPGEFTQTGTPTEPVVYWLDVQYVSLAADPLALFGWKTSLDHWNDDAVWAMGEDGPLPLDWVELLYPPGHPFATESIDLAFAITADSCPIADPPLPEPVPVEKNRFISLLPTNPGRLTALRVTLTDLPGDYDIWNGYQMWVTDPQAVTEQSGENGSTPPTFTAAYLTCQPDCRDWGALGLIDVYGNAIIPGAQYHVQAIDCSCDVTQESYYSTPPLPISTSRHGDIVAPFDSGLCWWPPPDGVVSIPFDTVADMAKFSNKPCAPRKARADLIGVPPNFGCLDLKISVLDYVSTVSAFQGHPYSIPPLGADPCNLPLPCPQP